MSCVPQNISPSGCPEATQHLSLLVITKVSIFTYNSHWNPSTNIYWTEVHDVVRGNEKYKTLCSKPSSTSLFHSISNQTSYLIDLSVPFLLSDLIYFLLAHPCPETLVPCFFRTLQAWFYPRTFTPTMPWNALPLDINIGHSLTNQIFCLNSISIRPTRNILFSYFILSNLSTYNVRLKLTISRSRVACYIE